MVYGPNFFNKSTPDLRKVAGAGQRRRAPEFEQHDGKASRCPDGSLVLTIFRTYTYMVTRDYCFDFKYFLPKNDLFYCYFMQITDHNVGFKDKR
jgi:hypothetical protein